MTAVVAIGWGLWQWNQKRQQAMQVSSLVPTGALALVEVPHPVHTWQRMTKQAYWPWLQALPTWRQLDHDFMALKLALKQDTDLVAISQNLNLYMSLHSSGRQGLGTVFYLPISADGHQPARLFDKLLPATKARSSIRAYKGYQVQDYQLNDSTTLSVLPLKHYWAVSLEGNLIDDVARHQEEGITAPWLAEFQPAAIPTENDIPSPRLVLNLPQLPRLSQEVLPAETAPWLARLLGPATLTLEWNTAGLMLDGPVLKGLGQVLDSASGAEHQVLKFVPHQTALALHVAKAGWLHAVLNGSMGAQASLAPQTSKHGEAVLAYLEHPDPAQHPALLVLEHADVLKWAAEAKARARADLQSGQLAGQTWFLYVPPTGTANYNIGQELLGAAVPELQEAFCMELDQRWLLVASSLETLGQAMEDYRNGESWDLGDEMRPYLEVLKSGHCALWALNPARASNYSNQWLQARWRPAAQLLTAEEDGKKALGPVTAQLYQQGGELRLQFSAQQVAESPASADPPLKNLRNTYLPGRILDGARLWRSETDRGLGAVVLDSLNKLYFIDKKGVVADTYRLGGSPLANIRAERLPLQRVMAMTTGKLHLWEGKSRAKDYPITFPDSLKPVAFNRIFYPEDNLVRWSLADARGQLWLLDEQGKALEGWNPKRMPGPLVGSMQHFHLAGQDVMLVLERQGRLHLMNRRGEDLPGWPVMLPHRCSRLPFVQQGFKAALSTITVLTDQGMLMTFNLAGQLQRQVQLLRHSATSKFSLLPETQGQTFSIAVQDADSIKLYDATAKPLALLRGPKYGQAELQYYHFGAGNEVWAVRLDAQGTVWLHTKRKVLGGGQGLLSEGPVAVLYSRATRAWFVLRSAGHRTYLTAVRDKAWEGVWVDE